MKKIKLAICFAVLIFSGSGAHTKSNSEINFAAPGTLLYKTDFSPAQTILSAPVIKSRIAAWQNITGINVATGSKGPMLLYGAIESGFDMIADTPVSLSTIGNYITNEIQQVVGPTGSTVYALFQNLNKPGGKAQDAFMIQGEQISNSADIYYVYWFKFQPDLSTQIGRDGRRVMSELKTGTMNEDNGDYRIITHVYPDASGILYWNTHGDNQSSNPIASRITFWDESNTTVPVPVGQWFKYEVFWHRSSGSDGQYWTAVNSQVIVDHMGSNMGAGKLSLNRVFLNNAYGSGAGPLQQWTTGLEIWDGFPSSTKAPH